MKKSILFFLFLLCVSFSNSLTAQIKHFKGNWTKLETTYDFAFDLYIKHVDGNQVEGVFSWEFVNYDEKNTISKNYYEEKIGAQAKEYVKGTYDPKTKQYYLRGYKKEDPNRIISLDHYRIKEDKSGNIGGDSKTMGTWEGRINGQVIRTDNV